jgi:glycosyltransferase involved in cell wall biosynthesis
MNPPKVMVLIATTIVGGPGKGVLQLLDRLKDKNIEFVLVAYKLKGTEDTEFIQRARQKGLQLEILEQSGTLNRSLFQSAEHLIDKYKINLIQSHGYKSHLIALYLHYYRNIKWLSFVHGWSTENIKVRLYSLLELILIRFSDKVIAVSPSIKSTLSKWRVNNVITILNAVDKNELPGRIGGTVLRRNLGISESNIVIGTVGRLSPEKGHKLLLKAISKIKHNGVKLLIVGDGPLFDELKKLCSDLRLNTTVLFCGYDQYIKDYYEALDLLVLPSLKEGLPNVVLEAMAFGVPVISTDVGGVREIIIDNENGWIIQAGSVQSIADKVQEVLADKPRLNVMKDNILATISTKFCADKRAEEIINVYIELIS